VIQDPSNRYITTILSRCDLSGKEVLEIGCGKGRITRDLAKHAQRVFATDPDLAAIEIAKSTVNAGNITFIHTLTGLPDLPDCSLDVVIYTLSLHHVPVAEMSTSLNKAARLLNKDGVIVVLEPGDGGSFSMAKEHFGAGSGDERPVQDAAIRAMHALDGWGVEDTIHFRTQFQFDNEDDFLANMLPGYRSQPESFVNEVRTYLHLYRTVNGVILDADRRLNVLRRL